MLDDRHYLEIALEEAEIAFSEGTIPIGAVIVGPEGEIISRGRNRVFSSMDPSCHAEIDVIRKAGKNLLNKDYKNKCTMYTTVEPCLTPYLRSGAYAPWSARGISKKMTQQTTLQHPTASRPDLTVLRVVRVRRYNNVRRNHEELLFRFYKI